ncbi:MAG: putative ABC transport system permease protein [Algoriphagus sp.]|jgi:putative ABC transport system permease protein
MIKNYFKIAWRNLLNLKSFGLINLVGLTAGTICSLAILLYVQNQFGYEEHFKDYQNIYKVATLNINGGDQRANMISSGPPIGPTIAKDYEEVMAQARIVSLGEEFLMSVEGSDKSFFQSGGYLVDSTLFDVFNMPLLHGDSETALANPSSIILSSKTALKLFGSTHSAVGQHLKIISGNDENSLTVTAVFDENLGKTRIQPTFMMSMGATGMGSYVLTSDEWSGNNFVHTYIKIHQQSSPSQLAAKFPNMLETYGAEQLAAANKKKVISLIPITDVHLKTSEYEFPLSPNSSIKYIYMLLAIGFFIQLMACVNYINLTTAQATRRAKEIGVRKVNGAASKSLMYQFIVESLLVSLLAVLMAIPALLLLLPYVNELFGSDMKMMDIFSSNMFGTIALLGLITGLLSGIYPAFYLSVIEPLKVLKKGFMGKNKAFSLRNGLVVFQFSMVFLLIYAVAVISKQINHMSTSDMGFSQNQKLIIPLKTSISSGNYVSLKSELEEMSQVNNVGASEFYPSQNIWYDQLVYERGKTIDDGFVVQYNLASEDFFETMGIELVQGRSISPTDTSQMVVNQAFLRKLGIEETEAVGTIFNRQPRSDGTARRPFTVVGVIKDYNFLSLKDEVLPVATFYDSGLSNAIVNYSTPNTAEFLANIEQKWSDINPGVPFEFTFLDKEIAAVYADEQRLQKVSYTFTTLAIIISLLGIWGLVSFSLERRTKEIGVRKVLGASERQLTQLLSKEFVILVVVSILIAAPLAIYGMNSWLDGYAQRIQNTTVLLVLAAILTVGVNLLTVVYKTILAARANPIDSIKIE